MEKIVAWAAQKSVEEADDSVAMAALLGAGLDSATFATLGVEPKAALVAGAATGAGLNIRKKLRGEDK